MIKINNTQIKTGNPASNFDKLFLSNLSKKAFRPFGDYEEVVLKWFESEYSRTLIATYKERPAGFAMLGRPIDMGDLNNSAELLAIAVVSEYSKLGIGSNLLKRIDDLANEIGTKIMFLHTATENKSAIKLFSSSGFRVCEIKKEFYPRGQDSFVMAKKIQ